MARQVLFVCIGNSCRSQIAEAFARAYGSGVMMADSAGLQPCEMVSPVTQRLMREKNLDLTGHYPKGLDDRKLASYDLIVNMSGQPLPNHGPAAVREWDVQDPIWLSEAGHRAVRDQIEGLVRGLIDEFRALPKPRRSRRQI